MTQAFTLKAPRWYAAEWIEDGGAEPSRHVSPIHVQRVTALKTGNNLLRVEFHHDGYPEGVQGKAYQLQILERTPSFLIARVPDVASRVLLIHELTWPWLTRHFRLEPHNLRSDPQDWKGERARPPRAQASDSGVDLLSRIRGCLLGGAIGDALGYPFEFVRDEKQLSQPTPGSLVVQADGLALVSDDTQMTLFCVEGILRAHQRIVDRGICNPALVIENAFDRWLRTQVPESNPRASWSEPGWLVFEPRLHHRRAPGNTCLSALQTLRAGGTVSNNSKGCGAVMRSAPFGLAGADAERVFELARDSGRATHQHPSGYLSAAALACLIFHIRHGMTIRAAMSPVLERLAREDHHEEVTSALQRARDAHGQPLTMQTLAVHGEGWTGEEALAIAARCALEADEDPQRIADVLWAAVAHPGDSDSTGSIAGNLLGARHGLDALPTRWVDQVELRPVILRLADDLHAIMAGDRVLDTSDYPPN